MGANRRVSRRTRRGVVGSVYPRGRKWWYALELAPDALTGKRRRDVRGGFHTENEAWEALIQANRELAAGRHVKATGRTVSEFLDEWLLAVQMSVKPTTWANYSNYARFYVKPFIGGRKLQDIGTATIAQLYSTLLTSGRRRGDGNHVMYEYWTKAAARDEPVTARALAEVGNVTYSAAVRALQRFRAGRVPGAYDAGLAPRTVQSVHIMLRRAFADAVRWRYIADNPVIAAPRIRRPRRGHSVWPPDQLRRFLVEAEGERLFAMWLTFATTGMRRSEAAGARLTDLDLQNRTITLRSTRVVAGGAAYESDGKSRRSRRQLALDRHTSEALAAHLATIEEERAAFGASYADHGLLFCWQDGRPLHPDTITEQFNRLVDRARLPAITLHDVRHTYATMSLRAGVNPKIVSARLGHANVAFTLDTYTEDVPELHHDAAEVVSSLFVTGKPPAKEK